MTEPFWIDSEYDRDYSNDGRSSRFASYVRQAMPSFAEAWDGSWDADGTVLFACAAWRTATSPVMAPGYVREHGRILSAQIVRNDWDGSLAADVSLVTGRPASLTRGWGGPDRWHDWPTEHPWGAGEVFLNPSGEDVSQRQYLMTSARLCFPMPETQAALAVPHPGYAEPGVTEQEAREAVEILVDALNEIVGPVLRKIEEG